MIKKLFFGISFLCFIIFKIQGQPLNIPLEYSYNVDLQQIIQKYKIPIHCTFKPLNINEIGNEYIDTALFQLISREKFIKTKRKQKFWQKISDSDLISIHSENVDLYGNILFDQTFSNDKSLKINTRGFEVKGNFGNNFSFYSSFYENQATFPAYIDSFCYNKVVVPGQGARKDFGKEGHDFSMSTAYLSYSPYKFVNIQLGYDKNFLGNGYRSLLLSDNSFNYPFLKLTFDYQKFRYIIMFTEYLDFEKLYYNYHHKKHGTVTYLSWLPFKDLEVSVFESIVWKTTDSTSVYKFDSDYFKQIIGFRLINFGLDQEDNMLYGLDLVYKPGRYIQIYGQFALDSYKKNIPLRKKYGYQIGLKCHDVFFGELNKCKLFLEAEYNRVRPFTYSNSNPHQSYTAYNQALAHPLGAGFSEVCLLSKLSFGSFFIWNNVVWAVTNKDNNNHFYGSDIFVSDNQEGIISTDKFKISNENKQTLLNITTTAGFVINPRYNFNIFISHHLRSLEYQTTVNEINYFSFGIRTSLRNFYYDF